MLYLSRNLYFSFLVFPHRFSFARFSLERFPLAQFSLAHFSVSESYPQFFCPLAVIGHIRQTRTMTTEFPSPTTSIVCKSSEDLVIIAPYVLGYIFNDSLVVFLMSKNRCRGALRIAVDATVLQQNVYSEECIRIYRDIAESIADMVRELKQIDSIAFLLYSSIPITDPKLLPGHTLIACCEREIHSQNKKVLDSVYVTETSWCSYTASENTPFGGKPLTGARNLTNQSRV